MGWLVIWLILNVSGMHAATVEKVNVTQIVQEMVQPYMREKDIPGVAVAVYFDGQGYLINFGMANRQKKVPVTSETIFELASITKVFTSTALAMDIQSGRMQLNDSVIKYLPMIRNKNIPLQQISLGQLATHTSSLPRTPTGRGNYNTPEGLMLYFEHWSPTWPIGSKYLYSNIGFGLLGYALAGADNEPYSSVLENKVLRPLGMNRTVLQIPPQLLAEAAQGYSPDGKPVAEARISSWPAGGALHSTGRDMLAFLEANLGVSGPADVIKAMQYAQQGLFKANQNLTLGLGWQRFQNNGELLIDKNGGLPGFSSYIGMTGQIGVVLLANKEKSQMTEIGRRILMRLAKE